MLRTSTGSALGLVAFAGLEARSLRPMTSALLFEVSGFRRRRFPRIGVEHTINVLARDAIKEEVSGDISHPREPRDAALNGARRKLSRSAMVDVTITCFAQSELADCHLSPSRRRWQHSTSEQSVRLRSS